MKTTGILLPHTATARQRGLLLLFALLTSMTACDAAWQQESNSLTWTQQGQRAWRFNYQRTDGKPFFEIAGAGGVPLTTVRPADHPWHYGLWFSWKYLNGVNYWEQDRTTGKAEGRTSWNAPVIETNANGSARITMELQYLHPSGRAELTERRALNISPPGTDGTYAIEWDAHFKAGTNAVTLDRTPMPGEPKGQVNGGYAGLSLRMAAEPVAVALVSEHGAVTNFVSGRARPETRALASNFSRDGHPLGGIAIVNAATNAPIATSPWYAVVNNQMRFFCSAILAPKPLELLPGETLNLRYRILVRPEPWTADDLATAVKQSQP